LHKKISALPGLAGANCAFCTKLINKIKNFCTKCTKMGFRQNVQKFLTKLKIFVQNAQKWDFRQNIQKVSKMLKIFVQYTQTQKRLARSGGEPLKRISPLRGKAER
jgi:hypothetical protein